MYIDIDKFKSFTDYYGLFRASEVILYLTDLIMKLSDKHGSMEDFLGHVGGDDFVVILNEYETAKKIADDLIENFDLNMTYFYDSKDVERNYITVLNREGKIEKFPFISVSIISIDNKIQKFETSEDIYKERVRAKKLAKDTMGSILLDSSTQY